MLSARERPGVARLGEELLGPVETGGRLVEPAAQRVDSRLRHERPAERGDVAALLRELQRLADEADRPVEVEAGDRGAGEVVCGARLQVLAADLASDLERLADPALVVVQVAEPPADPRAHRQRLVAILRLAVLEQDERLLDEVAAARQVGVAHERVVGERGERKALEPRVARLGRVGEDALHLDRLRRQVGDPPGGPGGEEAALERRLELDRADEQPPRRVVRLAREGAAAGLLERRGGARRQLGRRCAVELLLQRRGVVEVIRADLDQLLTGDLREPVRDLLMELGP